MNKQNQFLADYVYLAEASYTDFSKSNDDFKNLTSKRRVGARTHAVEHDKQCSHFSGSLKYSDD